MKTVQEGILSLSLKLISSWTLIFPLLVVNHMINLSEGSLSGMIPPLQLESKIGHLTNVLQDKDPGKLQHTKY